MVAQDAALLPRLAGIYCRLSYAPDGTLEKVERQERDCRELASRLRWPVSEKHIFIDNSRSAWQRNRKRQDWDRLLRCIEGGEIDGLLIYHGDRLIRQPWDLEKMISIADGGFRIASPSGTRSLDSPDDRFILRIEAAQACRESDNISRRVHRHVKASALRGRRLGGGRYRPFGFGVETGRTVLKVDRGTGEVREVPDVDLEGVREDEADLIRECVARLMAGQSDYGVRRWLSSRCTTTAGNPWSHAAFRQMILSPRIAGLIAHDGNYYQATWGAIIPQDTWEDLKALREQKALDYPYPGRDRKYLLSGVALCGRGCDQRINSASSGTGKRKNSKTSPRKSNPGRVYHCRSCGLGRDMAYTDAYVSGRVIRLLNDSSFISSLMRYSEGESGVGEEITALEARKTALEAQIESAADDPDVDPVLAMKALAGYKRRLEELRGRLAASSKDRLVLGMVGISRKQWEETPIDVRSAVVDALFEVVILPVKKKGPGFDPSSVRLIRRQRGDGGGGTS